MANLLAHDGVKQAIVNKYESGRRVAAVCAGPCVLGAAGVLEGKSATCFPGFEDKLTGAKIANTGVVTDGLVTTGRGLGFSIDLGIELINLLEGRELANDIKKRIQHPETI